MEAAVGLLLLWLRLSHGAESRCDGRRDGAVCHGTLGGTLFLRLMDDASKISGYEWKNETKKIMSGKRSNIAINLLRERSRFSPESGMFQINNLTRIDSSRYTLMIFNERNQMSEKRSLNLSVQAPVTSVQLTVECLSLGSKRLSCSSGRGDDPRYGWTLDGRALTGDQLLNGTGRTDSVTLKVDVLGQLVCRVHNHVSNASRSVELTTCGFTFINCTSSNGTEISEWVRRASDALCAAPTTASTTSGVIVSGLAGVLAALVVLTVVVVAVTHAQKKNPSGKTKEEEDDEELTYADVRSIPLRARPAPPRSDAGVEYGQVRFSGRPRQTGASGDDCVYSEVKCAR